MAFFWNKARRRHDHELISPGDAMVRANLRPARVVRRQWDFACNHAVVDYGDPKKASKSRATAAETATFAAVRVSRAFSRKTKRRRLIVCGGDCEYPSVCKVMTDFILGAIHPRKVAWRRNPPTSTALTGRSNKTSR
jgi:hypothetical protein